jgi:hypothetical protein
LKPKIDKDKIFVVEFGPLNRSTSKIEVITRYRLGAIIGEPIIRDIAHAQTQEII